ncbi:hypothetical protein EJ08DRAFT_571392, partial [Tothia fuscella]
YEVLPTPVTPVSAEALTSLLDMIKQVPDDETSRQHKCRLQQKITNAAHTSFARNALLQDRNQFLALINDEGRVRRSTKSEILGKARVMSYEDLERARVQRATKEEAKANGKAKRSSKPAITTPDSEEAIATKGKRGRKRKSAALQADPSKTKAKVVRMGDEPQPLEAPLAQMSRVHITEDEIAPQPWQVPVAHM